MKLKRALIGYGAGGSGLHEGAVVPSTWAVSVPHARSNHSILCVSANAELCGFAHLITGWLPPEVASCSAVLLF